MHPKKGLDLLVRSFLADYHEGETLILAGPLDKPDKYLTKLLNETKGLEDKIVWTGMLCGDLKWGALRSADALILPSHQENYGMVVAEALSVGTPIFLTDKVNLWREVTVAGAGFVAEDNERGVNRLLADWRTKRHAGMKEACMTCFEEKLHIRNCAKRLIELLNDSVGRVGEKSA
jgi:glycosyltransferase involved in cell wall biosynthesis